MSTTITQLSQSVSLDGSEKFAIDNSYGTFNTTLNSMSVFIENLAGSYPFTTTVGDGDRIKIIKSGSSVYSFQPGTSIFKDVSSGSDALSTQIVMGSDTRLSDSRYPLAHSHSINDVYLLQSELDKRIRTSSMGIPYGVASLDSLGKVVSSQLPDAISGQVSYIGVWNAASNSPLLSNTTGINQASLVKGNYYVVSVPGSTDFGAGSIQFSVGDWVISNGVVWQKVNNKEYISSVSGKSGSAVTLNSSDVSNIVATDFSTTLSSSVHISDLVSPSSGEHLANKDYVDTKLSLSGGTITGNLFLSTGEFQIGASDRFFTSSTDSISIRRAGNANVTIFDNGNVYIRSKLSVSGSLESNGNVIVQGTVGVNGVVFPDGTTQTTAYSNGTGLNFISPFTLSVPDNNWNNYSLVGAGVPTNAKAVIVEQKQDYKTGGSDTHCYLDFAVSASAGSPVGSIYVGLRTNDESTSTAPNASFQGIYPCTGSNIAMLRTQSGSPSPVIRVIAYYI